MTALQIIAPTDLEALAFTSGAEIEIDTAENRAYLRLGETVFCAELVGVSM